MLTENLIFVFVLFLFVIQNKQDHFLKYTSIMHMNVCCTNLYLHRQVEDMYTNDSLF